MNEFCVNETIGSEFWLNSSGLGFYEIQDLSFLPNEYRSFLPFSNEFANKLFSPINGYAKDFSPMPEVIDIKGSRVRFRQSTHAEIWVEPRPDGLYALDKCHQRQFYPSNSDMHDSNYFSARYRFYTPWILNSKSNISFLNSSTNHIFLIKEGLLPAIKLNQERPDPHFVDFLINKTGTHMQTDSYGIIEIGTPMYDFEVELTEEEMEKINV